jgi:peptidoglycan hydrolase CwlO-like protein
MQGSIEEVQAGWSSAREELSKLSNAYVELSKELAKSGIRMNMLEKQLRQLKKQNGTENESSRDSLRAKDGRKANEADAENTSEVKVPSEVKNASKRRYEPKPEETDPAGARPADPQSAKITPGPSDPDIMKEWEQWQEPKEWQGGS